MNNEFKWDEEKAKELIDWIASDYSKAILNPTLLIKQFKASKQVKEWEVQSYEFEPFLWKNIETGQTINPVYSVKRLSDGEIFTVGDHLNDGALGMQIGSIRIEGVQCILSGSAGSINLMDAKKKRTPLFTTHDNKPVYAGDKVWAVNEKYYIFETGKCGIDYFRFADAVIHHFSTREAAEEYTKLNTPKYSLQDFKSAYSAPLDSPLWNETVERLMNIEKYRV